MGAETRSMKASSNSNGNGNGNNTVNTSNNGNNTVNTSNNLEGEGDMSETVQRLKNLALSSGAPSPKTSSPTTHDDTPRTRTNIFAASHPFEALVESIVKSQQDTINSLNDTITEQRLYIDKLLKEKSERQECELRKQQEHQCLILEKHEKVMENIQKQLQQNNAQQNEITQQQIKIHEQTEKLQTELKHQQQILHQQETQKAHQEAQQQQLHQQQLHQLQKHHQQQEQLHQQKLHEQQQQHGRWC